MMNVGRVLNNPRFSQQFTVYRKSGSWDTGGNWDPSETALTLNGVISVADSEDIEQLPEGDMETGAITLYTSSPLQETTGQGTSDEIEWRGDRWRVMKVFPYADYGYYKAIAVKMDPTSGVDA